ncbi:S-layer homology domain-containing protein [Lysinibacillus sp. NPDC097231]|uniref:S-layer homology domain-containing protein n=1 Tax=Lysinibacillus sp. NPDC097231 TaxID=3364142 RepID=UPI003809A3CA
MDKTKIQKVNKALIATVFATSGIAVVVPPPQKAAAATSPFTDIDQYSSHYNEILNLYSQGVINGFADNTFRPNENVTRGQAAKMLVKVLKLDTKNVQDPYYKDVPKSNEFYKYVAALQNAGIMSGNANGTFMPNEVITRGELAKILVLGFNLEVSANYNNIFKDVNSQSSNAMYIQTLVDLGITEGTTPTFSPFNAVTREQFAYFIVQSQEKKNNATSFKITGVEDDIVYINGDKYTVPESLSHIFNEDNAPVLKGALVEGDFSGKRIYSVSKLTLNASGTSSRFLEFDGNYGSFDATIVVNGNYIEFSNVQLTGTMFVNETVRPPLHLDVSYNQPISLGRIASNNISFINWSNPDNSNGENSSSSNNSPTTDLQNWTNQNSDKNPDKNKPFVNWSKEKVTMKNVEKHIEFYNSTVSRLVVSQSGTKIETNTKLPRVDIIGSVREFEIQGDIGTLNLNTDTKLTIYGDGNIDWINYNSYTDLELYIDGRIGTLYVDNSYGTIDIGDYTYIDKVILPKGESPNNIFDDFLEDKDNVGSITDPDGKPIDKDDIENQNPADKTKPSIDITSVTVLNGSDVQVEFTSDKVGTYYYIVREKDVDAPTKREMVDRISTDNVASGTGAAVKGKNTFKITNLGEKKEYVVYVMVVDGAKNVSDLKSQSFQMKDASPPVVKSLTVTPLHGGTRAEFTFTASEPGDYYYYVRKKTTAADPTTADIVAKSTGQGKVVAGNLIVPDIILTGLEAEEMYQLYVVMKDVSGNYSVDPAVVKEFPTGALDNINPYVEKTKLESASGKENQFYIYLNEALDPESARDINNYDLSGTVIVNTTGQNKIKPSAVEYKEGDKKVLLTIPSETGFVYGDTLRVTVLPGVKDLADNEFENTNTIEPGNNVRNYAEYVHEKFVDPEIFIKNVISKPDQSDNFRRVEVEFKPNKAGTYYYMVLPDTIEDNGETKTFKEYLDGKGITERDFVNEFASDSSLKSGYFQIGGKNIYIEIGYGPADLEEDTKKFPIAISKDKLNPFISYSVYMVLKDRGGDLSKITSKEIFGDLKAPLITDLEVKSGTTKGPDDTKATVSFSTDETTKLHYWFVPKKNADGTDNPDANLTINTAAERKTLEDKLKASPSVTKSGKGASGTLDMTGVTLTPHTDYVVYLGAEDTYGNFTVYKANTAGDNHDETNTGWMKQDFYSDGTPPKIAVGTQPWIKKISKTEFDTIVQNPLTSDSMAFSEDKTFVVTFSEALNITDAQLLSALNTKLEGTTATISKIEWEDTTNIETWEPRRLLIQFNQNVLSSFTIDMNKGTIVVKDFAGLTFDKPLGEFKYQNMPGFGISGAGLIGNLTKNTSLPATSNRIQVVYTANSKVHNPKYYYVMSNTDYDITSSTNILTKQHIIAGIDPENNLAFDVKGSDVMSGNSLLDIRLWPDNLIGTSNQPEKVFIEDKYIYMVLMDDYGNISDISKATIIKDM